jgi:NADH-quinone oxidoreductase subunit I
MRIERLRYISGFFQGILTLITGLKVTFVEFFTKKTTEEYPENRDTLVMFERYRGTLTMPHDETGKNRCTACGLCEMNCPNDTLRVETDTVTDDVTGKKKKVLVTFRYDLGSCMFCLLCVNACPTDAIAFDTKFEHAVYSKKKLIKVLNNCSTIPSGI